MYLRIGGVPFVQNLVQSLNTAKLTAWYSVSTSGPLSSYSDPILFRHTIPNIVASELCYTRGF